MRLIIFGAGKMYQEYKEKFRRDIEIIAIIDNQADKWGKMIDGIMIYPPSYIENLKYDGVFLLSAYYHDMQLQLRKMGIPENKIYTIDSHIETLLPEEPVQYYGSLCRETMRKKILVFSHALSSTGAQNVLYQAVCILRKNNYQVAVVSKSDGVLRDRFIEIDVPVIIIRDIHSKKEEVAKLVDWSDMIFVNTLLLYDTVFEVSKYNKKLIWWIHESGELKYVGAELRTIEKRDNVFIYAVSPLVKRLIWKECGDKLKIECLTYGLPKYNVQAAHKNEQDKVIFAVIGWIGYIKGQDIFLDAVDKLPADTKKQAEFWIIGGGELSPDDKKIVGKYSCIKVLGEIENTKMHEIYNEIDVVVSSSREDAMPVVVTEGCMAGKLVIISDSIGTAEFIEHGKTGLIFKNEDVNELAGWMEWAVGHRMQAKQIGTASQAVYEQYFSFEAFSDNLLAVIGS